MVKKTSDNSFVIKHKIEAVAEKIVSESALFGQSLIQLEIRNFNHIDTGAMLNSVYAVTPRTGSDYSFKASQAKQLNKRINHMSPEFHVSQSKTNKQSVTGIAVNYAQSPNNKSGFFDIAIEKINAFVNRLITENKRV